MIEYGENPARMKYPIQDYTSARDAEAEARHSRRSGYKTLGHNTYIDRDGENIRIILHSTPIVIFEPDGHIILNSGGYHTTTTKSRMNEVLPAGVRVFAKQYDWYVQVRGNVIDFHDNMVIQNPWPSGEIQRNNPPKSRGYGNVLKGFGVVLWHEDSRYRLAEVVKVFARESAAEQYADDRNEKEPRGHGGYVVRPMASLLDSAVRDYEPGRENPPRKERRRQGEPWVDVWEERGNVVVRLYFGELNDPNSSTEVAVWRDEEVNEMVEDGFFKRGRGFSESVIQYAEELGLLALYE